MHGLTIMIKNSLVFFAYTVTELMVLFVGISFLVGVINEFVPVGKIRFMLSSGKRGYMVGAGLGAMTPFCSCSTIPITAGLLKAGAGFGPTMSFLLTSPLVNPVIISLFFMAFGLSVTVMYSIMALMMSVSVSYLLEKFGFQRFVRCDMADGAMSCCGGSHQPEKELFPMAQPVQCCEQGASIGSGGCCGQDIFTSVPCGTVEIPLETSRPGRWGRIFRDSLNQFKSFLPYILIGVALGALAYGFVPENFLVRYAGRDNLLAVPFSAIIGVPMYVRVETMIPVTIALIEKGMSLGAVIALVIGGAGASIPEVIMLKRMFELPLLGAFLLSIFTMATASGIVFNLMF